MKHLKKCLLIAGIVAVSGYGISKSIKKDTAGLSALTLANIEALADGEDGNQKTGTKRGYYNETKVIYDFTVEAGYKPVGIEIKYGVRGVLNYCKSSFWWFSECDLSLIGFTPCNV